MGVCDCVFVIIGERCKMNGGSGGCVSVTVLFSSGSLGAGAHHRSEVVVVVARAHDSDGASQRERRHGRQMAATPKNGQGFRRSAKHQPAR